MFELATKILLAYLIGTIMGGSVVGRLRGGVDLRRVGSGNVGATNALRTQGPRFALAVLAIDLAKGVLASLAIPALPWAWPGSSPLTAEALGYACGYAVALGHIYPFWAGFRGGKGVATLCGVIAALLPWALLWMLPVFIAVILLTGYVSLASVTATLVALLYVTCYDARGVFSATGIFMLAITVLILFKHRPNLGRLWAGREPQFEKAMFLRRWLHR